MRRAIRLLLLIGSIANVQARALAQDESQAMEEPRSQASSETKAQASAGRVVEPTSRAFGLVIGDVVGQRLLLDPNENIQTWHERLPEGRVGPWLERQPLRETRDATDRRWLSIDYQIVNAPDALVDAALPSFAGAGGEVVDAWPITITALTPLSVSGAGDLLPMRPIPTAAPVDTVMPERRLRQTLLAIGVVLIAWLAWLILRTRGEQVRLPFAAALYEIRHLPSAAADDDPRAWRALHQALDRTAGKCVTAGDLQDLYVQAPWLQPMDDRLTAFLHASNNRFFTLPAVANAFSVTLLGRELSRVERSEAR